MMKKLVLLSALMLMTACYYEMEEDIQPITPRPPIEMPALSIELPTLPNDLIEYDSRDMRTDWQGFRMYVEAGSVTPVGLRLSMINDSTELNFGHGVMFDIQQYLDGNWEQVPFIGDFAWVQPLLSIEPNTIVDADIFWEHMHGELPPGLYRIVRNFIEFDPFDHTPMWRREIPEAYLYATFVVTEDWQTAHGLWQQEQDVLATVAFSRFDGVDLEILEYGPRGLTFMLTNNNPYYSYVIDGVFVGWEDNTPDLGSAGALEYAVFPSWIDGGNSWPFGEHKILEQGEGFSLEIDWYDRIGYLTPSMSRLNPNPYIFEISVDVSLNVSEEYVAENFHHLLPNVPSTSHRVKAFFDIS